MELILALPQQLKKHNGGGVAAGKDCETATNLCSRSKIDSNKSSLRKDRVGGGKEGLAQNNYGRFEQSKTRNLCSKSKIDSKKSSLTTVDIAAAPIRKNNHEQRLKETAAAPILVKGDSTIGKKPIKLTVKIGSVRVDEIIPTTKLMMGKKNSGFSRANQKEFKTNVTASKQEEKKKELMKQEDILVKKGTRVEKSSDYGAEVIRQMFGYYLTGAPDQDNATFAHHIKKRSAKIMEDRDEQVPKRLVTGGCRKKMRLN